MCLQVIHLKYVNATWISIPILDITFVGLCWCLQKHTTQAKKDDAKHSPETGINNKNHKRTLILECITKKKSAQDYG